MSKTYQKKTLSVKEILGYNDRLFMLVGIVIVSLIMPIAFFNAFPIVDNSKYVSGVFQSMAFTIIYWVVSRAIFLKLVRKFPKVNQAKKRAFWTYSIILIWTVGFSVLSPLVLNECIPNFTKGPEERVKLTIASVLVTAAIVFLYEGSYSMNRWRKSSQQAEALRKENYRSQLETLKNQINPHFLFNSLNTLSASIHSDPDMAVDFVQNMSDVYRYVLETKHQEFVPLREELKNMERYLYLLKARFGDKLHIEMDESLRECEEHIVPLALQMLLENAIKHNIVSTAKPLNVEVNRSKEGHLVVRNNNQPKLKTEASTGTGLNNIGQRYKLQTNEEIDIIHSEAYFTVVLPLIKIESYAHIDH